jgi:hypothetical protein
MAASQEEVNKSAMVNATNTLTVLLDLKHTRYKNIFPIAIVYYPDIFHIPMSPLIMTEPVS